MPNQNLNPTNHKEEMGEHIFVCGSNTNRYDQVSVIFIIINQIILTIRSNFTYLTT